ncbi:hypothetical protein BpHYR1_012453, partial [Brachionus plicatilis]
MSQKFYFNYHKNNYKSLLKFGSREHLKEKNKRFWCQKIIIQEKKIRTKPKTKLPRNNRKTNYLNINIAQSHGLILAKIFLLIERHLIKIPDYPLILLLLVLAGHIYCNGGAGHGHDRAAGPNGARTDAQSTIAQIAGVHVRTTVEQHAPYSVKASEIHVVGSGRVRGRNGCLLVVYKKPHVLSEPGLQLKALVYAYLTDAVVGRVVVHRVHVDGATRRLVSLRYAAVAAQVTAAKAAVVLALVRVGVAVAQGRVHTRQCLHVGGGQCELGVGGQHTRGHSVLGQHLLHPLLVEHPRRQLDAPLYFVVRVPTKP